jgi:peptidoglycan/LPS O-acetylase OafA/YrhL
MDRTAIVLILLGIALAAVSGFADTVGIGDDRGFHYRQAIGVGVGAALVVAGVVVGLRRSRRAPEQGSAAPTRESDSTR